MKSTGNCLRASKDLEVMKLEELVGILIIHEEVLQKR